MPTRPVILKWGNTKFLQRVQKFFKCLHNEILT